MVVSSALGGIVRSPSACIPVQFEGPSLPLQLQHCSLLTVTTLMDFTVDTILTIDHLVAFSNRP